MSEHDQGRGRWGDAGGLDGAITGSPRFSVAGGGTRLRVEYRVEGRGVVELTYAPKGRRARRRSPSTSPGCRGARRSPCAARSPSRC
ncbi:hypothetical protein ACFQVA_11975 [Actinomadura keratinilytica]